MIFLSKFIRQNIASPQQKPLHRLIPVSILRSALTAIINGKLIFLFLRWLTTSRKRKQNNRQNQKLHIQFPFFIKRNQILATRCPTDKPKYHAAFSTSAG